MLCRWKQCLLILVVLLSTVVWQWSARITNSSSAPVLDCPSEADLGIVEIHQISIATITVGNKGGIDLTISDVRSSCSCAGLETLEAGIYSRFRILTLKPNESKTLYIRQAVNAAGPSGIVSSLSFSTNDPDKPQVQLPIRVRGVVGGFELTPTVAAFGIMPTGESREILLTLHDHSGQRRKPAKMEYNASNNLTIAMRSVEVPDVSGSSAGDGTSLIAIRFQSEKPSETYERVRLHFDPGLNLAPIDFFVTAVVRGPVTANPSSICLPLRSDSGLVHTSKVMVRSTSGEPFTFSTSDPPSGWICAHEGHVAKTIHFLDIEQTKNNDRNVGLKSEPAKLTLTCKVGVSSSTVTITLINAPGMDSR